MRLSPNRNIPSCVRGRKLRCAWTLFWILAFELFFFCGWAWRCYEAFFSGFDFFSWKEIFSHVRNPAKNWEERNRCMLYEAWYNSQFNLYRLRTVYLLLYVDLPSNYFILSTQTLTTFDSFAEEYERKDLWSQFLEFSRWRMELWNSFLSWHYFTKSSREWRK